MNGRNLEMHHCAALAELAEELLSLSLWLTLSSALSLHTYIDAHSCLRDLM